MRRGSCGLPTTTVRDCVAEADWESILQNPGDFSGSLQIAAVATALIVGGLLILLHYRREQTQRHKELMAMIQAGMDPHRPPK